MSINPERINNRIRHTWRLVIRFFLLLAVIFGIVFFFSYLQRKNYQEKYESSTWRVVEAVFDHASTYTEREQYDDDYIDVEYYAWYFTYQGLDGNTYTYVERKKSFVPNDRYTTTIYVDEHDDSRTLEIRDYSDGDNIMWTVFGIVIKPFVVIFVIVLTILYVLKYIAKNKQDET